MRFLPVAAALIASACAANPAPPGAPALTVEFSWNRVPRCSNVSPRIVVYNAPAATRRFRVELVDLDSAVTRHGGGEVAAERGGTIPAGALKSYRGPCPAQQPIAYEMRVSALDENGRILAFGAAKQTFTPVGLGPSGRR